MDSSTPLVTALRSFRCSLNQRTGSNLLRTVSLSQPLETLLT